MLLATNISLQASRCAASEFNSCSSPFDIVVVSEVDVLGGPGIPGEKVRKMLGRATRLAVAFNRSPAERSRLVRGLFEQVIVDDKMTIVRVRRDALFRGGDRSGGSGEPSNGTIELRAALALKRRGVETKLMLPALAGQKCGAKYDPALIKALTRGHGWFDELAMGCGSIARRIGQASGNQPRYIRRLVGLAFLSPRLIEAILQGRQPVELTATRLTEIDLPLDWAEQHRLLVS
jgi:hypothetical protein